MTARTPDDVLRFWFEDLGPAAWWEPDRTVDRMVRDTLQSRHEDAVAGRLEAWREGARGALALILLLDQVSRNLHRNSAAAYANDSAALHAARAAAARRQDLEIPFAQRQFCYMPFMHAEDLAAQDTCVRLFRDRLPGDASGFEYALHHREIVARFGRFPHRNRVLGRQSTPEEETWLAEGGFDPA